MEQENFRRKVSRYGILLLLLMSPPAFANPTPLGSSGRNLRPVSMKRVPEVAIFSEKLTIEDGRRHGIKAFVGPGDMMMPCVRYHAEYRFKNRTDKPRTLKVGFPVIVYNHKGQVDTNGGLQILSCKYGTESIPVQEISRSTPTIYPVAELSEISPELLSANLAKSVPESPEFIDLAPLGDNSKLARKRLNRSGLFSAKRIEAIMQKLNDAVFGDTDFKIADQELVWYSFPLTLPPGLSEKVVVTYDSFVEGLNDNYSIPYIMRTGRYWGDKVGRLEVVFNPDRKFLESGGRYDLAPKNRFMKVEKPLRYVLKRENAMLDFNILIKRVSPDLQK